MRDLHELPKLRDGLTYLYLEHGRVEQEAKAVAFVDDKGGCIQAPAAALAVVMLGPGTTITHAAVKALADNGCLILWTGEDGTRLYAQGSGETRKAYHLLHQARLACDPQQRLAVIRRMYQARFPELLDAGLTLEQVRGLEGVRVRQAYARASQESGVPWRGRLYDRQHWERADPVNRALSAANALLNGICHAGVVSGGYSSALGFVHTGKQLSFVYDIADLYKAEITIPLAFAVVAQGTHQLDKRVRMACRAAFKERRLLERILPDIDGVLGVSELPPENELDPDGDPAAPGEWWGTGAEQLGEDEENDGDDSGESAGLAARRTDPLAD
jgi:CRISPR-associated protein Cas1